MMGIDDIRSISFGDVWIAKEDDNWLLYLYTNSIANPGPPSYKSSIHFPKTQILRLYGSKDLYTGVLFLRTGEKLLIGDNDVWLKERVLGQEIPWGLSRRLISCYSVLCSYNIFDENPKSLVFARGVIRLWRETLRIGRRKLLVTSDEEIDILEDFRDIAKEMLMELLLEGDDDDKVRGICIYEPDYSFL